jgi:hypothetical protein
MIQLSIADVASAGSGCVVELAIIGSTVGSPHLDIEMRRQLLPTLLPRHDEEGCQKLLAQRGCENVSAWIPKNGGE